MTIKMFVLYTYTEGFKKTRHTLVTLRLVRVRKMSNRRRRDEDN